MTTPADRAVVSVSEAIARLETLRAESTPGRWDVTSLGVDGYGRSLSVAVDAGMTDADKALVVLLHGTIEVQLCILNRGLEWISVHGPHDDYSEAHYTLLAEAILRTTA